MSLMKKVKKEVKARYKEEVAAYKQKSAANKLIRKKARAAAFREREKQAIKTAQQRERMRGKGGNTLKKFGEVAEAFAGKPGKKMNDPLSKLKL